jgi:hypothetical protein
MKGGGQKLKPLRIAIQSAYDLEKNLEEKSK